MRSIWKDILTALFMGMVLPGVVLNGAVMALDAPVETQPQTQPVQQTLQRQRVSLPVLVRHTDGTVEQMDMDDYLTGVVLAEMPASFETEALKAQSVAARTYACKAYQTGGKHADGSVCTQSTCCQAYLPQKEYLLQGGTVENVSKVRAAVEATSGYVLTYEGELIEATYFSCSGGSTEDAAAVWGAEFPYLQAVESPGEEDAAHFSDTFTFSPEAFQEALGVTLEGSPSGWFGAASFTDGGGIESMDIGGKLYTGVQLRSLLKLPSTDFTVSAGDERIVITTYGYGHRVGMSQYGADAMAVTGSSYADILAYYYQGTELTLMDPEKLENGAS